MAGGERGDGASERVGFVVRAVVGDHPDHPVDAVGGEERPGAVEEPDRGGGLLVGQVLGVGQAGEPVDGRVQVDVASAGAGGLGALDGPVLPRAAPVGAPATTVGDAPDLLDVDVDHVAGVAGSDHAPFAVGGPVRVNVAATVDAQ